MLAQKPTWDSSYEEGEKWLLFIASLYADMQV